MNLPCVKPSSPSFGPTPIVGKCVCIPVGPVGPVGAEGILLGGIRPILLGTFPNLPSLPRELGTSLANFPKIFVYQNFFL